MIRFGIRTTTATDIQQQHTSVAAAAAAPVDVVVTSKASQTPHRTSYDDHTAREFIYMLYIYIYIHAHKTHTYTLQPTSKSRCDTGRSMRAECGTERHFQNALAARFT